MKKIGEKGRGGLSLILGISGSVFLAGLLYLSYRLAELGYPGTSLSQILTGGGLIAAAGVLLAGLIFGVKAYISRPRIRFWSFLGMSFSGISLLIFAGLLILSFIYPDL